MIELQRSSVPYRRESKKSTERKTWNRKVRERKVGGYENIYSAMKRPDGTKLCRIAKTTEELKTKVSAIDPEITVRLLTEVIEQKLKNPLNGKTK